jgi:hypothetical protein
MGRIKGHLIRPGTVIRYIGLAEWNITQRTVALPDDKGEKYMAAIADWESRRASTESYSTRVISFQAVLT